MRAVAPFGEKARYSGSGSELVESVGMEGVVASNAFLIERLTSARAVLNAGHSLHLFGNNLTPVPADGLTAFTEIAFPGYAAINLNGQFGPPLKVQNGRYLIATPNFAFTATGVSGATAYGWYVRTTGALKFSARFPDPIVIGPATELYVRVEMQEWSLSIVVI